LFSLYLTFYRAFLSFPLIFYQSFKNFFAILSTFRIFKMTIFIGTTLAMKRRGSCRCFRSFPGQSTRKPCEVYPGPTTTPKISLAVCRCRLPFAVMPFIELLFVLSEGIPFVDFFYRLFFRNLSQKMYIVCRFSMYPSFLET